MCCRCAIVLFKIVLLGSVHWWCESSTYYRHCSAHGFTSSMRNCLRFCHSPTYHTSSLVNHLWSKLRCWKINYICNKNHGVLSGVIPFSDPSNSNSWHHAGIPATRSRSMTSRKFDPRIDHCWHIANMTKLWTFWDNWLSTLIQKKWFILHHTSFLSILIYLLIL